MSLLSLSLMAANMTEAAPEADSTGVNERSIVDEVIWVVGDEAILKSDVEAMRRQAEEEGTRWNGDPDCVIRSSLPYRNSF